MTQPIYKTEKRKARVGERILITNVSEVEDEYENGDVFEVDRVNSDCSAVSTEGDIILDYEYEVIVGEHTQAPNLDEMSYDELVSLSEAVMKALRKRSYKLGYDQGRFDAEIEAPKSDQQKRDEVVAKAKEDVRQLLENDNGHNHEFVVNIAKRTVVDLRKIKGCTNIARRGIAKCATVDCFNAHIGKAIALRRALGWSVPAEYLNVPQPTEVRVGDYVARNGRTDRMFVSSEDRFPPYDRPFIGLGFVNRHSDMFKIIDDSRAGEGE